MPPTPTPLRIRVAADAAPARQLRDEGWCPVECAFGTESVTDSLAMDHHGTESWREPVALRAWRDHRGARREDPRFVSTGRPDADATFAIAALAGLLPPKSASGIPIDTLARRIAELDTDPFRRPEVDDDAGLAVLLHNRLASPGQDPTAFHAGVDRWRLLLGLPDLSPWLEVVRQSESSRRAAALQARVETFGEHVAVVCSPVWGWDVWYARIRPVIVAYVETAGRISIGCHSQAIATRLLGERGLLDFFDRLTPPGWGGRETIGGSPRNAVCTWQDAVTVARLLAAHIEARG